MPAQKKHPNIILFITDQQRFDTIHAQGASRVKTPNIDRLMKNGVSLSQCYCTAPSCVPSRASMFTMKYPHETGVYHNGSSWGETSWMQEFQSAGYHTVNIGKMHTVPFDISCGYDERFVVENKDRPLKLNQPHGGFYDEWDKFLNNNGIRKPSRETYKNEYPDYETALGAYEWPLEESAHPDIFVGNMARWFVEQRQSDSPLFLEVGFPGPHPPYDPPMRYLDMYEESELPFFCVTQEELEKQPSAQTIYRQEMISCNHDAVRWRECPDEASLRRLHRYYAANITLIDDQIGLILSAMEEKGYLDNAIIVFMSDHGDCLGEHGHIQKWTMYDSVVRTPIIICAPGLSAGTECSELLQQMDIVPMLFELAGVPLSSQHSAVSALPAIQKDEPVREYVFAEHSRDNILKGVDLMQMIRSKDWKLVDYDRGDDGELYDLKADPKEINNLWNCPEYTSQRAELLAALNQWAGTVE